MNKTDEPLDADDLLILAERVVELPAEDAEWVGRLVQELLRAPAREARP